MADSLFCEEPGGQIVAVGLFEVVTEVEELVRRLGVEGGLFRRRQCPETGQRRSQAVTLADGVFAPESPKWTESVVFKETVSGRFGFAVEVTEPLSDAAAEAFVSTSASALVAGETSSKGEKFLWTYDHGDSLEPATPGSRPTGLVFDYAGRRDGLVILLK
mgnify:CR=1 FL=1